MANFVKSKSVVGTAVLLAVVCVFGVTEGINGGNDAEL